MRQKTAAELAANCRIDTVGTGDKTDAGGRARVAVPDAGRGRSPGPRRTRSSSTWRSRTSRPTRTTTRRRGSPRPSLDGGRGGAASRRTTVLIQSFWPPNLDRAKAKGFPTSLLAAPAGGEPAGHRPGLAERLRRRLAGLADGRATRRSSSTPAHAAGMPVVPYTIDTEADIQARARRGRRRRDHERHRRSGCKTLYGAGVQRRRRRARRRLQVRAAQKRSRRRTAARADARGRGAKAMLSARKAYNRARQRAAQTTLRQSPGVSVDADRRPLPGRRTRGRASTSRSTCAPATRPRAAASGSATRCTRRRARSRGRRCGSCCSTRRAGPPYAVKQTHPAPALAQRRRRLDPDRRPAADGRGARPAARRARAATASLGPDARRRASRRCSTCRATGCTRRPCRARRRCRRRPSARFGGRVEAGERSVDLDGWVGMVGHNWGAQHAERWIWMHGLAFDGAAADGTWIDAAIGRIKLGPWTTPWIGNGEIAHRRQAPPARRARAHARDARSRSRPSGACSCCRARA